MQNTTCNIRVGIFLFFLSIVVNTGGSGGKIEFYWKIFLELHKGKIFNLHECMYMYAYNLYLYFIITKPYFPKA